MNYGMALLATFVAMTIGWLCYWLGFRAGGAIHQMALDEAGFRMREAGEVAAYAKDLLNQAILELEAERRKSDSYFETIESVLRQSKTWQELYQKQAIGHGNAQALMMDGMAYLTERLRKAGVQVEIPPLLKEVQSQYREEHVFPVTEMLRGPDQGSIAKASPGLPDSIPIPSAKSLDLLAAESVGVPSAANTQHPLRGATGTVSTLGELQPGSLGELFPRKVT